MKFKTGDTVLITAGKDKGKQGKIVRVYSEKDRVIVENVNMYTKHVKPMGERSGEKVRRERPLPVASIAIINDKGQADRIGYQVSKSGAKERVFKKTGKVVDSQSMKTSSIAKVMKDKKTENKKKEVKKEDKKK